MSKGILTPIVCLLWSESVDEFVNLEFFPLDLDSFHTEKNPSKPKCVKNLWLAKKGIKINMDCHKETDS